MFPQTLLSILWLNTGRVMCDFWPLRPVAPPLHALGLCLVTTESSRTCVLQSWIQGIWSVEGQGRTPFASSSQTCSHAASPGCSNQAPPVVAEVCTPSSLPGNACPQHNQGGPGDASMVGPKQHHITSQALLCHLHFRTELLRGTSMPTEHCLGSPQRPHRNTWPCSSECRSPVVAGPLSFI